MPRKKKPAEESGVAKGKGLFDLIGGITADQSTDFFDNLTEDEQKTYKNSRYMMHRFLSMNPAYAPVVNEVQRYPNIPDRAHYLTLTNVLPKGKQFHKYIKSKKEETYEPWLVDLLTKYFNVSKKEALDYLDIYYEHNRPALRLLCEMHGIDSKTLKKIKL
jgi:hypothetical protein